MLMRKDEESAMPSYGDQAVEWNSVPFDH
jgi:hypothetical protein